MDLCFLDQLFGLSRNHFPYRRLVGVARGGRGLPEILDESLQTFARIPLRMPDSDPSVGHLVRP